MSQAMLEQNEMQSCCCFRTVDRACLYRYVELAFAEADDADCCVRGSALGEAEFLLLYSKLMDGAGDLSVVGMRAARRHFTSACRLVPAERSAAYRVIAAGVADVVNEIQDGSALAAFYHRSGVEVFADSDSLANRLCIQLQFLQLLCLREDEAARRADRSAFRLAHATAADFLDSFLLPLVTRLADIAEAVSPSNPYGTLLEATRCLMLQHRHALGPMPAWPAGTGLRPCQISNHVTRSSS